MPAPPTETTHPNRGRSGSGTGRPSQRSRPVARCSHARRWRRTRPNPAGRSSGPRPARCPSPSPVPRSTTNPEGRAGRRSRGRARGPRPWSRHPRSPPPLAFARTIVLRDVGFASNPRTVLSANSRPKTQAVRNANRTAPPTATAWPSRLRYVGQSAVPAVSCAFAPSSPSARARSGSLRMTMNRPMTSGASEKPMATPHGTRERRAFSISVRTAATKPLTTVPRRRRWSTG